MKIIKQKPKKLISFIIPVYNEESNISFFWKKINETTKQLSKKYKLEYIYTDNHSSDKTFEKLENLGKKNKCIKVIRFSKNFGYQKSIKTGLKYCYGDAAIQIDADLQDPPELIKKFIEKWEQGFNVVYGIRKKRDEFFLTEYLRKLFYRLINLISKDTLPLDAGDFRLLDKKILDELRKHNDAFPYIRGSSVSLGYKQFGIEYTRRARLFGKSKFPFNNLCSLALDGILNHSIIPLRISAFFGLIIAALTVGLIIAYFFASIFFGKNWPAGFATITLFILLSISLNGMFLGIIGEYIGRIYVQVKNNPLVVIEKTINLKIN